MSSANINTGKGTSGVEHSLEDPEALSPLAAYDLKCQRQPVWENSFVGDGNSLLT